MSGTFLPQLIGGIHEKKCVADTKISSTIWGENMHE